MAAFVTPGVFDTTKWRQLVGDFSPESDAFTTNSMRADLVGRVPWANSYEFYIYCLGYHYTSAENKLRRVIPIKHPFYDWAYCQGISDGRGVKWPGDNDGRDEYDVEGAIPSQASYKDVQATLHFAPPQPGVRYITDEELDYLYEGKEQYRYTWMERLPQAEFLEVTQGQLVFNAPGTGVNGRAFANKTFIPTYSANMVLHWYNVPIDYVQESGTSTYPKIEGALNKLNSTEFMGYPAGTLLTSSRGLRIEPKPAPLRIGDESDIFYYVDVSIPILWTDPPNGLTSGAESLIRGHRLRPAGYGDNEIGKWYPVEYKRNTGSTDFMEEIDYSTIFEHWNA